MADEDKKKQFQQGLQQNLGFQQVLRLLGLAQNPEEVDEFEEMKRRNLAKKAALNEKIRQQVQRQIQPDRVWGQSPDEPVSPDTLNPTYIGNKAGENLANSMKNYQETTVPQERQKELNTWREKFPTLFNWLGGEDGE